MTEQEIDEIEKTNRRNNNEPDSFQSWLGYNEIRSTIMQEFFTQWGICNDRRRNKENRGR
jgi:hypothetical protein